MSATLSDRDRETFGAIADVLIPAAEGMPAASQIGVQGAALDHVLSLRPELRPALERGLAACAGAEPTAAAEALNRDDPEALGAIGLIASAIYYMDPDVRKRLGYPGQEQRPARDEEEGDYLRDDLLQSVIDRGAIYRRTPDPR